MKILQTTMRYSPALGGVEDYVRRTSEGMVSLGHEVTVYSSDLMNFDLNECVMPREQSINNVKVKRFRTFPMKLKDYIVSPALPFSLLRKRADLIHGHSFMHFSGDSGALAAKIRRTPFVFNPYIAASGKPSLPGALYRKTLGKLAMSADVVIAISHFEKSLIREMGYKIRRIEIIPPGIDLKEFDVADSGNVFQRFGINAEKIILSVGRLSGRKGIDTLIKAMPLILKKIPEARLLIAGPDFGQRPYLESLVRSQKVEGYVLFIGALLRSELINVYKHADIFAFSSRNEAFGIVLIEAMAAGLPVVAANACAVREIVKEGRNGYLFSPGDIKELSEKIITILSEGKLRSEMANSSYNIAKDRYDVNKTIAGLLEVYSSLIKN